MIALLDTNILIASDSDGEAPPDLGGFDDLRVSSLSWAELTKGLHTASTLAAFRARSARLGALRRTFGAGLPFDDDCVDAYDEVLRVTADAGGTPRAHVIDRMIAATAIAGGMTLVSRDERAFAGLGDLLALEVR